ncbi:helix-turn-helix domain-containing protein [Paracholeplasma manati]|uniref:Helix-turn-helix transcriptional regulator n=1 Tax=Paracholeplasma manati TaxID=591373 RepID=A0ABT2Y5P0_9MOLU|nr:helix-turn-helix transcriptional regulator [Paracholeplasma manati]MCV2232055.1 helix-turn-helix transcriptional regulator [Paracholeplasma manati]MDG0887828.1 helix-turn-helix transcriptional regulator [Paracholeplasma manati]
MDVKKTGTLLKSLRLSKGYTQQQVADVLLVSPKTISKWENGDGLPDISIITAVADLYEVSVDTLLRGKITEETTIQPAKTHRINQMLAYKLFSKLMLFFYISLGINLFGIILGVILYGSMFYLSIVIVSLFFIISIITFVLGYVHYQNMREMSDDDNINCAYDLNKTKVRRLIWWIVLIDTIIFYALLIGFVSWSNMFIFQFLQGFIIEGPILLILFVYSSRILSKTLNEQTLAWNKFLRTSLFFLILLIIFCGFQSSFKYSEIIDGELYNTIMDGNLNYYLMIFFYPNFYIFRGVALLFLILSGLFVFHFNKKNKNKLAYILLLIISLPIGYFVSADLNHLARITLHYNDVMISYQFIYYVVIFFIVSSKLNKMVDNQTI